MQVKEKEPERPLVRATPTEPVIKTQQLGKALGDNRRLKLHPAPAEVGELPKEPKFGRKIDTIGERNAKIEAYTPEEYNHVYHLLNLKNVVNPDSHSSDFNDLGHGAAN